MVRRKINKFLAGMLMSVMLFNSAAPYYVKAEGEETVFAEEAFGENEELANENSEDEVDRESFTEDEGETDENVMPVEKTEGSEEAGEDEEELEILKIEDVEWQEPSADWYKDYRYDTNNTSRVIYLDGILDSISGNVVIPATAVLPYGEEELEYRVVIKANEFFWNHQNNITGVKLEKGIEFYENNCNYLFSFSKIRVIDIRNIDTSNVTNMVGMFDCCHNLEYLDLSGFDTSKVNDMSSMFVGCSSLTSLNLSGFDTSIVTNMSSMFSGCSSLTSLNLSGFDTSKVTNMSSMFSSCSSLTSLNLSGFDTSKVNDMQYMFYDCSSLTSLDLSGFDTSKVNDMRGMFSCSSLVKLDLSSFDVVNVETAKLFSLAGCGGLTEIKTPKSLCASISLPYTFYDIETGKEYVNICVTNQTLVRELPVPENGGFDLKKDGYCIANNYDGFKYKTFFNSWGYKIPLERYQEVFGADKVTKHVYKQISEDWGGNCFGMSSTAVLFYQDRLSLSDYISDKNNDGEIVLTDDGYDEIDSILLDYAHCRINKKSELTKLIERYQIWNECSKEWGDIKGLPTYADALKGIEVYKEPYIVGITWDAANGSKYGHALVVDSNRKPVDMEDGWTRIFLYDPNCPYFGGFGDKASKPYYDESSNRYIDINVSKNQWKMEAAVSTGADDYKIGYDTNGNLLQNSRLVIFPANDIPDNFLTKAEFSGAIEGKLSCSFISNDFCIYNLNDELLYQKVNRKTIYIDTDSVEEISLYNYVEGYTPEYVHGTLILPNDKYKVVLGNGSLAFKANRDYAGVMTADNPVTLVYSNATSLNITSEDNASVNVVILDHSDGDKYTSIQTDLFVGKEDCKVSLKDNKLNIQTNDDQIYNIDIIADNGYGEVIDASSNDVIDLNVSELVSKELKEYSITYDLDGGAVNGNPTNYNRETETFELITPVKDGFDFLGWTGSNGDTPEVTVVIGLGSKGDLSYKANWKSETVTATELTLSENALTMKKGDQIKLTAVVKPDDAQYGSLSWNSTDPSVASVDSNGLVSAIKEGNATVTVRIDGTELSASCNITVIAETDTPVSVNKITLDKQAIELKVGGEGIRLNATVEPKEASLDRLSWSSSDVAVATVSGNGLVLPVAKGSAVITVSADGCMAECSVVVIGDEVLSDDRPMNPVPVIDETTTKLHLVKGQKFTLPESGWTSANKKYVAISKKNVLTAKKATAEGIKISKDGREITIFISQPKMAKKSIKLDAGKEQSIALDYDSDNLPILWYSNAPDVATVSEGGVVSAYSKGTATITAYIYGKAYTCKVKVNEGQIAEERTLYMMLGKSKTISLKGMKKAIWTADDKSIVEIDGKKIKGLKAGDTIVSTEYEGKTYKIHVYVEDPTISSKGFTKTGANKYTVSLKAGEELPFAYNFVDQEVVFKSSKGEVAYWNDGVIVAQSGGKAKLSAKVNGKSISIVVNVTQ